MTWEEISDFKFGWNYGKNSGFVKLTLSDGSTEFVDNLKYDALNQVIDLLRLGAKYIDKEHKIISQIKEAPAEEEQPIPTALSITGGKGKPSWK